MQRWHVGASRNMNARFEEEKFQFQFQGPPRTKDQQREGVARRVRVCVTGRVFRRCQPRANRRRGRRAGNPRPRFKFAIRAIDKAMMVKGLTRFGNCDEKTKAADHRTADIQRSDDVCSSKKWHGLVTTEEKFDAPRLRQQLLHHDSQCPQCLANMRIRSGPDQYFRILPFPPRHFLRFFNQHWRRRQPTSASPTSPASTPDGVPCPARLGDISRTGTA